MAVPDFQSLMLPLLDFLKDGKHHTTAELYTYLAKVFNMTEEDRRELLPSGKQHVFENRVGWARTYLKKAGLLDSPERGKVVIADRGKEVLSTKPERISVKFLMQYPEFASFHKVTRTAGDDTAGGGDKASEDRTPEEVLAASYRLLRETLAEELLSKIIEQSPEFFERLVIQLLVEMGYGGSIQEAGKAIGRTGDEGIDGTIKEDRLGLDIIYIQAKKWARNVTVSRPELQKFYGALAGPGAKKGIFITTSSFSKAALEFAPRSDVKVVLIDGEQLTELMIDYDVGVNTSDKYEIKRIDMDFFEGAG